MSKDPYFVAIIGAGFSGICTAIQLKKAGIENFVILERWDQPGGTWFKNSYPGAACDVPSHLYSYSFEMNPNWSKKFAEQSEIESYLLMCVEKYHLKSHLKLKTNVTKLEYNNVTSQWFIHGVFDSKIQVSFIAHLVISGIGGLSQVRLPDIPGIELFKGSKFHSAEWDHTFDLRDKKIAVVGTGASAIQIIPAIADQVLELHVFQRSPPWVLPKAQRSISAWKQKLFKKAPFLMKMKRLFIYLSIEYRAFAFVEAPNLLKPFEKYVKWLLKRRVKDPELREKLTPNYLIGCKRVLLSDDFYETMQQPQVELHVGGVQAVNETGVIDTSGIEHKVDAIIFATGFYAAEQTVPFEVIGRDGLRLSEVWKDTPEAYLGTFVHGFPNLFFICGPNSFFGHNSVLLMIETQVKMILSIIRQMVPSIALTESPSEIQGTAVEIRLAKQRHYNKWLQEKLQSTVWNTGGCRSWYLTQSGRNTVMWPGPVFKFRHMASKIKPRYFHWTKSWTPRRETAETENTSFI